MTFNTSELMKCYRAVEQAEQTSEVKKLRLQLKKLLDKIELINALDDSIREKSSEMSALIGEAHGEIDEINRYYHIF